LYPEQVNYTVQNLLGSHDTERFLTLCTGNKAAVKLAWLFQMTYIGAPMVYYGDEVGMTGGKDPGCRGTMIWNENEQDRDLLATMKQLISLRTTYSVFRRGTFETAVVDDERNLYGYWRRSFDGRSAALVVLNNSRHEQAIDLSGIEYYTSYSWDQVWPQHAAGIPTQSLPGLSGLVLIGER
jgi:glycosidase